MPDILIIPKPRISDAGALVSPNPQNLNFVGFTVAQSGADTNITAPASNVMLPNELINGAFRVSQFPAAPGNDGIYGINDFWYPLIQTGQITVQNTPFSSFPSPLSGFSRAAVLTQPNATPTRYGFAQLLEGRNSHNLQGEDVVLSGYALAQTNAITLRYAILSSATPSDVKTRELVNDWSSTTYTPGNFFDSLGVDDVIAIGSVDLPVPAGNWTKLPDITGVVPGTVKSLSVFLWTEDEASQNTTLWLAGIKLERGSESSPYLHIPYSEEISAAQRYIVRNDYAAVNGQSTSWSFPSKLFKTPTFNVISGGPPAPVISFFNEGGFMLDDVAADVTYDLLITALPGTFP